jgi:adenylosuccinate synthase
MPKIDIILDLSYGDCGKGKVSHECLKYGDYTHCVRWNGSSNAGHTIWHDGEEYFTHLLPAGFFFGKRSIIGPQCLVNVEKFFDEVNQFKGKFDVENLIRISDQCHIITSDDITEDEKDTKIGTTRQGTGPCAKNKFNRTGKRVKDVLGDYPELKPYVVDFYEEMYQPDVVAIMEGAQGFYLDITFGDYPYVTSGYCSLGGVLINGFNHKHVRRVFGVAKAYETYVGAKDFQPEGEIFHQIAHVGREYGVTTGRKRKVNFLDIGKLKKAVQVNGIDELIINKMDILQEVDCWKIRNNSAVIDLYTEEHFKDTIIKHLPTVKIHFSYDPKKV